MQAQARCLPEQPGGRPPHRTRLSARHRGFWVHSGGRTLFRKRRARGSFLGVGCRVGPRAVGGGGSHGVVSPSPLRVPGCTAAADRCACVGGTLPPG